MLPVANCIKRCFEKAVSKKQNWSCSFGPHCFPGIQSHLRDICQLPALPRLHNNTAWMQKGNDVF